MSPANSPSETESISRAAKITMEVIVTFLLGSQESGLSRHRRKVVPPRESARKGAA